MEGPAHHSINKKLNSKLQEYQKWQSQEQGAPSKEELLVQLFRAVEPYNTRFHEEGKMYHEYDRATQRSIL